MSDSRKSTLEHLRKLTSLAALAATACKPGASKEDSGATLGYGVVDPMPPPALDAGVIPTVADAGVDSRSDAGRKDAGPSTIKVPTLDITSTAGGGGGGGGPGYGVVDPMPPPTLRPRR